MTPAVFLLFLPVGLLISAFFVAIATLVGTSLTPGGVEMYMEMLVDPVVLRILVRTIWIAIATTILCALLGMPIALFLARSPHRNLWLIVVISPWLVSIVVRTFGWMILLGNSGALNSMLLAFGLVDMPVRLLFTPYAIIVGLTHVFLPFMVIAMRSSLLQQDHRMEEAGRILGGTRWQVFRRITLPLTISGICNGASLVLLLTIGAIVTPLLLGGMRDRMLGTQIYTEIFQVFNFERATAMAVLLLVVALILLMPVHLLEKRLARWQEATRS